VLVSDSLEVMAIHANAMGEHKRTIAPVWSWPT